MHKSLKRKRKLAVSGDNYKIEGDFATVGEILEETLSNNFQYRFALKCSTLFSFWEQIVGPKFAKFSKPITLTHNKLAVSCKNPAVAQELTMFKPDLLKKIEKYASPLKLKVNDLIFSYKNWEENA